VSVAMSVSQAHSMAVPAAGALKKAAESARGGRKVGCSIVETFSKEVQPRELEEVLRWGDCLASAAMSCSAMPCAMLCYALLCYALCLLLSTACCAPSSAQLHHAALTRPPPPPCSPPLTHRLEYRSKLLNPRWAQAMAAQGSGGAFEISQRMTAMVGWGATTEFKEDWAWDQVGRAGCAALRCAVLCCAVPRCTAEMLVLASFLVEPASCGAGCMVWDQIGACRWPARSPCWPEWLRATEAVACAGVHSLHSMW
jgi:hypothetical protein